MCLFCQIIAHQIPSYKIWEDETTLIILDNAQDMNYHMLIMPKKHVTNIMACDQETLSHLIKVIQMISNHCIDHGFTGVNILNANGKAAGQSIQHLHFHLLARKNDDGIDAWPKLPGSTISPEESYSELKFSKPLDSFDPRI